MRNDVTAEQMYATYEWRELKTMMPARPSDDDDLIHIRREFEFESDEGFFIRSIHVMENSRKMYCFPCRAWQAEESRCSMKLAEISNRTIIYIDSDEFNFQWRILIWKIAHVRVWKGSRSLEKLIDIIGKIQLIFINQTTKLFFCTRIWDQIQ